MINSSFRVQSDTYDYVADENLEKLRLQAGSVLEGLLQYPDEEVAHRSADESTVHRHLGDARGEVVAILVSVLGEPRSKNFLETGESTGCQHLGPEGVLLELLDIGL